MDFLKHLIQFNNEIFLKQQAEIKYPIHDDDDPEFIEQLRKQFMNKYNKSNNRQMKITYVKNSIT